MKYTSLFIITSINSIFLYILQISFFWVIVEFVKYLANDYPFDWLPVLVTVGIMVINLILTFTSSRIAAKEIENKTISQEKKSNR